MIALSTSFTAHAEGNCPGGSFPIGRKNAGTQNCAPMAGDNNGLSAKSPKQHWWGSIATGEKAMGGAEGMASKEQAEATALERCEHSAPNASCHIAITYYDQCAALAWGDQGTAAYRGPNEEENKREAMAACTAQRYTDCEIFYSACSLRENTP